MKRSGEKPQEADARSGRAEREAEREADGGDADTNAQLRAMRAVWLSMRDEDPPDGGLVDLLAAARAKATTLRARPTFRQRVLAALRRPPALAFATVVVLVGGAVLLSGRRDRMSSEPRMKLAPPAETAVVPEARDNDEMARPPSAGVGTAGVPTPGPSDAVERTDTRAVPGDVGGTRARTTATPPAAATRFDAVSDAPDGDRATSTVPGPAFAPGERLHRQCELAAERGDCATVRRLIERIARQDRGYRARIAKDSAVGRCLASGE